MSYQMTLKETAFRYIRAQDVELAEDFNRRAPEFVNVPALCYYTLQLIASYPRNTQALQAKLPITDDFNVWWSCFSRDILPYMSKHRLPEYTVPRPAPIYSSAVAYA